MYQLNEFKIAADLDHALADKIADLLLTAINENGKASLAVSGGSTPKDFFKVMSTKDIPWEKVTITLADERWVPSNSQDSNTQLVKQHLLQNKAKTAQFFDLKLEGELSESCLMQLNKAADAKIYPLDVVILGMGEDGHTASLFPCSDEIEQCLATEGPTIIKVVPQTAPHQRISFSFAALSASQHIFLHIKGQAKQCVLQSALEGTDAKEMPIRAFLQHHTLNINIYWAE